MLSFVSIRLGRTISKLVVIKKKIPGQKLDGTNVNYPHHVLLCLVLASETIYGSKIHEKIAKVGG